MSLQNEMLLNALSLIGIKELKNGVVSEEVQEMFLAVTGKSVNTNTAWCSAFVGFVLKDGGYMYSNKLNARSYLKIGLEVQTPIMGDIVIFWRVNKDSWQGHVGFYICSDDKDIYVLGGNQSNTVCVKSYSKSQLLGYRRPLISVP